MEGPRTSRIVPTMVLALASAACASGSGGPGAAGGDDTRPAGTSTERLEEIYRARTDSARMRFTEADVRFMTGMIAHHAQAIVMSRLAPDRAASPSIQTLAARIINAQQDEIALMQQWLRERNQPVPEVHIEGTELMMHGADHPMDAPGMLTDEELAELERARGRDFDRLFLTYMIKHHEGAVTMVHDLFAQDGAGQDEGVFRLAADIRVDQDTEIARMQQMLDALPSSDEPHPHPVPDPRERTP